ATVPNYDYAVLEVQPSLVERGAENVLFVPSTVDRDNDVVEGQMETNWQWIDKVMKANNLEAAGPLQVVTVEFGSENYAFELAQPVRKAGTGPEVEETTDAAEGEAVADAEADAESEPEVQAPIVDAEPIEVELQ